MPGRSPLVATAEQKAALQELSRSDVHGEADRARAILLTLQGWTSLELAEAFGVTPEAVRHWRGWFADRGVDALRSTLAPGPSPAKGERALAVASLLLRQTVEDRTNWTLPRLRAEVERRRSPVIERQTGASISAGRLSVLLKKGGSVGAGPGTFCPGDKTGMPCSAWACGCGCARPRPTRATSCCCMATRVRR